MMNTIQKNSRLLLMGLILAAVTLGVFWQVMGHEFINYDDNEYVTENPQVQAGLTLGGLRWAMTTSQAANWHPVTWLSHMLDCQLFGMRSGWHHGMNLFFHLANTLLLFFVFHRMTGCLWQSGFVAALFGLHPLHVESVAWVAERKDVLSTFFWMLTMAGYVRYVEGRSTGRYLLVLLFFILGLMSKPMVVTLPFVLLLLDYWPLGRLQPVTLGTADPESGQRRSRKKKRKGYPPGDVPIRGWELLRSRVWEKTPLFVFSAVSCVITFLYQQKEGAMGFSYKIPLDVRIGNALVSYARYMVKMIWPQKLAIFYPYPASQPLWQVLGAALALVVITILVLRGARRHSYLAVGWFWFVGTLVPVIGLVQVGSQSMADRYTYLPLIGLFVMAAWGVPELLKNWRYRRAALTAAAVIVLLASATVTTSQVGYWRDSDTVFRHALNVTTNNEVAHNNLGAALKNQGKIEEALSHFREAVRSNPNFAEAHNRIASLLFLQGRIAEAEFHLRTALSIKPDFADAHYNLGNILASQGMLDDAVTHFQDAIRIRPNWAKPHNNLGSVFLLQDKMDEALAQFREALHIEPNYRMAEDNLQDALRLQDGNK